MTKNVCLLRDLINIDGESGTAHWVNLRGCMEICVSTLQSNSYTLGDLINLNGVVDTWDNYW